MQILISKTIASEVHHLWAKQANNNVSVIDDLTNCLSVGDDALIVCEPVFLHNLKDSISLLQEQCRRTGQPFAFYLAYDENNALICPWIYMQKDWIETLGRQVSEINQDLASLSLFSSQFINKIEYAISSAQNDFNHSVAIDNEVIRWITSSVTRKGFILCPDTKISHNTVFVRRTMQPGHWENQPNTILLSSPGCTSHISASTPTLYHSVDVLRKPKPLKNVIINYGNDLTARFLRQVAFSSKNMHEYEFYLRSFLNSERVTNGVNALLDWGRNSYDYSWSMNHVKCRPLWDTKHLFDTIPKSFVDLGDFWNQTHFLVNAERATAIHERWVTFSRSNQITYTGSHPLCLT